MSSPIRPEPGRGSEIFMVPRGRGFLRFRLRYSTAPTRKMAAPAAPTTIPALAPAVRPVLADSVEELDEDDDAEDAPVASASEEPCVAVAAPADEASLVASLVASVVAVA